MTVCGVETTARGVPVALLADGAGAQAQPIDFGEVRVGYLGQSAAD